MSKTRYANFLRASVCAGVRGAALGCAVSLLLASSASALSFNNLIVFGDSLVDQGNTQAAVLAATGGTFDVTPAAAGYFDGRFTNGINPADVLNQDIEGTNSVGFTFGGDNYAFGGARARNDADTIPDLTFQVDAYLSSTGGSADGGALYLLNVGGNDIRDIVLNSLTGTARQDVIDAAVAAISANVLALQVAGASQILFAGIGDVGSIPEILALGGTASADGRQASLDMNAAIVAAIGGSVTFFDTLGLFDAVTAAPALFGLPAGIDLTTSCRTAGSGAPPAGDPSCSGFAFFDEVHPTTQLLQILGNELIVAVPEPGTALLLLLGLAGLGAQRRAAKGSI